MARSLARSDSTGGIGHHRIPLSWAQSQPKLGIGEVMQAIEVYIGLKDCTLEDSLQLGL